jgi:uncharacterized protein involved in exopolysaccharide biosynthesis
MNVSPEDRAIDLRDLRASLRHGGRWIAGGLVVGLALAVAILLFAPRRYKAETTVLLRDNPEAGSSLAGSSSGDEGISLGNLAEVLSLGSAYDTEVEILTSRAVLERVADSLALQARVTTPEALPSWHVFEAISYPRNAPAESYEFELSGDAYRVSADGQEARVVAGRPAKLGALTFQLREDSRLPPRFAVRVAGMEETLDGLEKRLNVDKAGGDIAEVTFRARDPVTAAAVPNAMVAQYLVRRTTTDRGINQFRYEFLAAHVDSVRRDLAAAEQALRGYQERSGVLDPEFAGETELQRAVGLRADLEALTTESSGLEQLLARARPDPRELAAYPSLLRNGTVSGILSRILDLETRRNEYLERRTPQDPDVVVLTEQIGALERQLTSLSRSYLSGLKTQEAEIRNELGGYRARLEALPAHAERTYSLEREVKRLSETLVALQTQLVQTRLAAIAEGGEVRQIDRAFPPPKPSFPNPLLTLAGGIFGGLFFGVAGAVASGRLRETVREPREAELATGIPAMRLLPKGSLVLESAPEERTVLLVPLGEASAALAAGERAASTAVLQGRNVVLADLTGLNGDAAPSRLTRGEPVEEREMSVSTQLLPAPEHSDGGYGIFRPSDTPTPLHLRSAMEDLERRFGFVIGVLPSLNHPVAVALLGPGRSAVLLVPAGSADREELGEAVREISRMGARPAGVVLYPAGSNGRIF